MILRERQIGFGVQCKHVLRRVKIRMKEGARRRDKATESAEE